MRHQNWSQLKEFVLQLSKDCSFNSPLILGTEPRQLKLAAFRIQVWAKWKQFSLPQEVTEIVETVKTPLFKLPSSLKPTFHDCLLQQKMENHSISELKGTREGISNNLLILQLRGMKQLASLNLFPHLQHRYYLPAHISQAL